MVLFHPCWKTLLPGSVLILLFQVLHAPLYAQLPVKDTTLKQTHRTIRSAVASMLPDSIPVPKRDILFSRTPRLSKDSIRSMTDTAVKNIRSLVTRPALRVIGGWVGYQFNYRSIIDTPFAEKDILQHQLLGQLRVTVAGNFPLQINYRIRKSNSQFFRDMADVQASFNAAEFRNNLQNAMRSRLLARVPQVKDSLLEKLYGLKQIDLTGLEHTLNNKFHPQKLIEANETLRVPKLTWQIDLPDSVNLKHEDSLKKKAQAFLDQYAVTKKRYDSLSNQVDSLKELYTANLEKVNRYKQLVNGKWDELQTPRQWKNKMSEYGMDDVPIPKKYRWLLGIRHFSLGRSPVNHSELTAKNLSVNGVNFEYNSWYYLAFTAGMVNYRFRDFVVNGYRKQPQYMYMMRAGIGRLEKNYFMLSAFRGQKQLFRSDVNGQSTIRITGISAESRWSLNRHTWLKAEVAKSMAPDFRVNPVNNNTKFNISDKDNRAMAIHLYSAIPLTGSRIEGFYKSTGANYQSFSHFTTNAAMESWYIKAEQNLFKRMLRLAGALRKNEFTNPFILQDYTSNTVFKSLTATVRMRKLPVVTIGYQPMSQYTKVDSQVIENRFQTLNATLYHYYTIKQLRLATTAMLNKFYNSARDTGFLYHNAVNSYIAQTFLFKSFTASIGASYTKNGYYTLQVLEGSITPNIPTLGTATVGIRINNLNRSAIKSGAYINMNCQVFKTDRLFISYEHGYLPGNNGRLVRNEMGLVQYIKTFNFK
jgi:hypothetical protein